MKLLQELNLSVQYLTEENKVNGEKNYFVEGIFMQSNLANRNGRVYPKKILEEKVDAYVKDYVQNKRAFGELGHPEKPAMNLDKVSHVITELRMEGENVLGKAKILNTPNGKIVKALMDEDCQIGISSRGLGSVKKKGHLVEVQTDFRLITAGDLVHDPSAPEAFLNNLMESADWVLENGDWVMVESLQNEIHKEYKSSLTEEEKYKLALTAFEKFLKEI